MVRFVGGIFAALLLLAGTVLTGVYTGAVPAGADVPPSALESFIAERALHSAIAREMPPIPARYTHPDPATLAAGAKLYAADCAVCHGTGGVPAAPFARGFAIRAPQFAKDDVSDDPVNETYWKIAHGIRFTAMPAFGATLSVAQMWRIAAFLKRAPDQLSGPAKVLWMHSNVVSQEEELRPAIK